MSERNSYVRNTSTWSFSGVESEEDLILARAGIFYAKSRDQSPLNIGYGRMDGLTHAWTDGRTDGWTDGRLSGRTEG